MDKELARRIKISETMKRRGIRPVPHKTWNKGLTKAQDPRIPQPWLGKKRSNEDIKKMVENHNYKKGEEHPNWNTNPSYRLIHNWLNTEFGKANKCENQNCTKKSNNYDYALIKGKSYERKKENFMQLCKSCHKKYDNTPTTINIETKPL